MDSKVNELDINNLLYVPSTPVEVSINRVLRKFYPDRNVYGQNEKINIRLHGNQFIDPKGTCLRVKIKPTGNAVNFGYEGHHGSAANIAARCRVLTSTGKVVSDCMENHLLQRMLLRMKNSQGLVSTLGEVVGVSPHENSAVDTIPDGNTNEYIIPMRMISPFFDNDQLLPPRICENMIIEIYVNTLNNISSTSLDAVEVSDVELIADSVVMDDSVTQLINGMINDTLVYEYKDWIHQQEVMSAGSNETRLIWNRPVSNALECFSVLRKQAEVTAKNTSSYKPVRIPIVKAGVSQDDQYRARIGEVDLPQQPALGGTQIYNLLATGRGVVQDSNPSFCIRGQQFEHANGNIGGKEWGNFSNYYTNLRTSKVIENSGREISNQQNLSVYVKASQTGGDTCVLDTFLHYIGRIVISKGYLDVEI